MKERPAAISTEKSTINGIVIKILELVSLKQTVLLIVRRFFLLEVVAIRTLLNALACIAIKIRAHRQNNQLLQATLFVSDTKKNLFFPCP